MRRIVTFMLAMLLLSACSARREAIAAPATEPNLTYLLTARQSYAAGEPVLLKFELHNLGDATVYVLKWYTPLEGIWGNIFRLTRDGEEIPYSGPMVKRGDPQSSDYIEVAGHGTVSGEVDLARTYDLSKPGTYRVEFSGDLPDVVSRQDLVPQPRDKHQARKIPGNKVSFEITQR
ncbi:MAG TPA: hypothetical protein VN577_01180 [Terriglobales bacterium]|nr:hypothetical protein [Terriglobales bacterium]